MTLIPEFTVKDSGQRQAFDTGSVRDSRAGKGRYDLLPTLVIRELAQHYEAGAVKYGDHNWKKGQPIMRYVDSAMRHIAAFASGENTENHAIAAMWNMGGARWTLAQIQAGKLPPELDDRPLGEDPYYAG